MHARVRFKSLLWWSGGAGDIVLLHHTSAAVPTCAVTTEGAAHFVGAAAAAAQNQTAQCSNTCQPKYRPHLPPQSMHKWRQPRHRMKAHTQITHGNPSQTNMPGQRDGRAPKIATTDNTRMQMHQHLQLPVQTHTHTQQAQAYTYSNAHTHTRTQAACTEQAHAPSHTQTHR